jgi:DNA-binding transcriptional LysR family regulator
MKINDLSTWEAFLAVSQSNQFSKAAEKLKIGAPLLTKKIQILEQELGVRLFQRTTRRVSLTQEGIELLPKVKAILEDLANTESQFENLKELEGTIRISCITAFTHRVLTPILVEFQNKYPKVKFEIDPNDNYVDLVDSVIDIAIRVDQPRGANFIYKKLTENKLVAVASPEYLKKSSKKIKHPKDLKSHKVLSLSVYENCIFKKTNVRIADIKGEASIVTNSGLYLTELALQGAGIAIRSIWDVEPYLKNKKLLQVLPEFELENFGTVYAVMTGNRLLAKRVRVFMDFLEQQF